MLVWLLAWLFFASWHVGLAVGLAVGMAVGLAVVPLSKERWGSRLLLEFLSTKLLICAAFFGQEK